MRSATGSVSLLALAHLVAAQKACLSLTSLFPQCALPCVTSAAKEVGCMGPTDIACRCIPASSSAIQSKAVGCVIAACTKAGELGSAIAAGGSVCGCVATAIPDPTDITTTTVITTTSSTTEPPKSSTPVSSTSVLQTSTTTTKDTTSKHGTTSTTGPIISTTSKPATTPPPTCNSVSPCQASADAVPDCAETCIFSAAVTGVGCKTDDFECQCASSAAIQNAAQGCVIAGCGIQTGISVLNSVSALCNCVKANPTTPCTATGTKPSGNTKPTETSKKPTDTNSASETKASKTSLPGNTSAKPTCTAGPTKSCAPVAATAIPGCAQGCLTSAAPNIGCDVEDFACQCQAEAQASLSKILVPCVASACPGSSLQAVITGASSVCACATAPPSSDCSTTEGNGGGTVVTKTKTDTATCSTEAQVHTSTCKGGSALDCGPVATSAVPSCAHACFSSMAPRVGCAATDYACQCKPAAQASLSQLLVPCVATACPGASLPAVITGASSVCACATAAPGGGDCGSGGSGGGSRGGGATITTKPGSPTGGSGGGSGGNTPPAKTGPVIVVPGAAARFEIGLSVCVFGAVWLAAIAL